MDQPFDVLAVNRKDAGGRWFDQRDDGRGCRNERVCRWNAVDGIESQKRRVVIVENAVVPTLMVTLRVSGHMPVHQEMFVAVVLSLMDMLPRGDGKSAERHRERDAEKSTEHCAHPSAEKAWATTEDSLTIPSDKLPTYLRVAAPELPS